MIFNTLDFHISTRDRRIPDSVERAFRLKINYILDLFSLRIPKKVRTRLFHKLNVVVSNRISQKTPFFAFEGIGMVELVDPSIATLYKAPQAKAAKRVKALLRRGIRIAARYDRLFAGHQTLWRGLLSTTDEPFDYDCRVSRSHPSRRWRCEAVLRITPAAYHYDVLIKDSKTLATVERHRIKSTECVLPLFSGIGFSKLRWDKATVVGLTWNDKEVFRLRTKLQPKDGPHARP